ncbi:MAG: hypothetical protein D6725_07415 [Planctomycetota bacterium]|nr:MAG: hypothetical protein D6725_07415 [Planctomycetota bacterium]
MESPELLAVALLAITLGLIIAEVFIPSGGVISLVAIACLVAAVYFAWKAWWRPEAYIYFWLFVLAALVLIPGMIAGLLYVLPRTRSGRELFVAPPEPEEVRPFVEEEMRLKSMVGRRVRTISRLSPGGLVDVDGERVHCETPGVLVGPGEIVEVIGVRGNRLLVMPPMDVGDRSETSASDEASGSDDSKDEPHMPSNAT